MQSKLYDLNFLGISILASVLVSVLLKIAKKQKIDISQAVAFNYPVALLLAYFFLKPDFSDFGFNLSSAWYLSLGFLLPFVFILMGKSVQIAGIVKSDAAQRLSLVLALLVTFLVWKEPATPLKIAGILIALIALVMLLIKNEKSKKTESNSWIYLLGVWLGYGVIDLIFKTISKTTGNEFSTTLVIAFLIATVLMLGYLAVKKVKLSVPSLLGGLVLGVLNFTNIYTYIKAHQVMNENPSLVFTAMNIGVIALGTLVGSLIFKEKLIFWNYLGILLAVSAILLLFAK